MKNTALVAVAALLVASASIAWAQDTGTELEKETVFNRFPSALGAYVNYPVTGGLTYQRWFGPVGLEATAGAIVGAGGDFDYNVQAAFQYMIYGEDFADWFSGALYTNALVAHRGQSSAEAEAAYRPSFYLGAGVGIEMVFLRHLSTSVEFMYVGSWPLELVFGFGGSLKYRF